MRIVKPNNALMKSLLKSILRRISKKMHSPKGIHTFAGSSNIDPSVVVHINGTYDKNVTQTILHLKSLANEMSNGYVKFKDYKTRNRRYNPVADSTLYASHLLRAASILEYLLLDKEG